MCEEPQAGRQAAGEEAVWGVGRTGRSRVQPQHSVRLEIPPFACGGDRELANKCKEDGVPRQYGYPGSRSSLGYVLRYE